MNFKKILTYLFLLINLLIMGGGAYFVFQQTLGQNKGAPTQDEFKKDLLTFEESLRNSEPVFFPMEMVYTNLEGVPRRRIRLQLDLEMMNEEGFEEVMGLGAEARDTVIHILNRKSYSDLVSIQGKLQLKSQITSQINAFLKKSVVKDVYFSDFAIE